MTVMNATTASITVTLYWWDVAQGAWWSTRLASATALPGTGSPIQGPVRVLPIGPQYSRPR